MPRIATNHLDFRKLILQTLKTVSYLEKIKWLVVENTYTDHENNIQGVFESTGAKFSCVTVSQPAHLCPASAMQPLWIIMIPCIILT